MGGDLVAIINFNYDKAISQAKQIEDIAGEMLSVANNRLQTSVDSIGSCWRGDASKQFLSYCGKVQNEIRDEARKLNDIANRIRDVSRTIRETEERAKAATVALSTSKGSESS